MDPALNNPPQPEQQNGGATPNPMPKLEHQSSTGSLPLPAPPSQTSQQSQSQIQHGHPPQQPAQQNQQQGQHTEQRAPPPTSASYPSSAGYPSPGLGVNNNQYAYPPAQPQQQQQVSQEAYRASPTGSNGSMSLPGISSLNTLQQQQQGVQQVQPIQQQQQYPGNALPPPNVAQMPAYYHSAQTLPHPGHQSAYPLGVSMGEVAGATMRYALPPTDHRVMSGGRHKKEIKRRTKTGCLTCRKRRIKCDEQHPACRNCQKSKRECLGYDPIFKQQPGPPQIQPAPHSSAPQSASTLTTSNPYGNQPLMQGYGPNMSYDPNMPGSAQNFDYSGTIDPALEAGQAPQTHPGYAPGIPQSYDPHHQPPHMGHAPQPPILSYNPADVARHTAPPPAEGNVPPHSYYPSYPVAAPVLPPVSQLPTPTYAPVAGTNATPSAPPKQVKIEDLLIELPASETKYQPEQSTVDEIRQMFLSIYIPGLESFLESRWFTIDGANVLMRDATVLEHFAKLLAQFMKASENNEQEMMYAYQIEVRVVWELAHLVSQASSITPTAAEGEQQKARELPPNGIPTAEDAEETLHRLRVWEHLLSGTIAPSNPLTNPIGKIAEHHKLRELDFWYSLGKFVTLPIHDNSAQASSQIDETLSHLRNLLDGRENRDVLYSVAVVRALGQRVSEYGEEEKVEGVYLDEQDARSKVVVAKRFVNDEAGRGTTNVIRRFCELGCRALGIGINGMAGGEKTAVKIVRGQWKVDVEAWARRVAAIGVRGEVQCYCDEYGEEFICPLCMHDYKPGW